MNSVSRRSFIRSASALTAGAAFIPHLLSCSPSKKMNVAIVGVGGRGGAQWGACLNQKGFR